MGGFVACRLLEDSCVRVGQRARLVAPGPLLAFRPPVVPFPGFGGDPGGLVVFLGLWVAVGAVLATVPAAIPASATIPASAPAATPGKGFGYDSAMIEVGASSLLVLVLGVVRVPFLRNEKKKG